MDPLDEAPAGRTNAFVNGSESVREPQFRTMQRVGLGYRKTSILDNLQPTGNGMSGLDRQRQMFGVRSLGQTADTADKGVWLRNPTNNSLYNTNNQFG